MQMRTMQYTASNVKGTFTLGMYADKLASDSEYLALINGLDHDYCRFLAFAKCMCEYHFAEIREKASPERIAEYFNGMLDEPVDDNVIQDIMYLFTKTGS